MSRSNRHGLDMKILRVSSLLRQTKRTKDSRLFNEPAGAEPVTSHNVIRNRNDPCVCGSGKKFKRCCLGKKPKEATLG